jgi:hypothetical protein
MPVPPAPVNFSSLNAVFDLSGNGASPVFLIKLRGVPYVVKKEASIRPQQRSALNAVYGVAEGVSGGSSGRALMIAELASLANAAKALQPSVSSFMVRAIQALLTRSKDDIVAVLKPSPAPPPLPPRNRPPAPPTFGRPLIDPFDRAKWQVGPSTSGSDKQKSTWILMEYISGMMDLKHILKARDASDAANALSALFEDYNLDMLGRILVSDIFLGNNDRFTLGDCDRMQVGEEVAALWEGVMVPNTITNSGNIIFLKKDGQLVLSGMDPLDPTSGMYKLEGFETATQGVGASMFFLKMLPDRIWRAKMAELALRAISGALEMKCVGGPFNPTCYTKAHVEQVLMGMDNGLAKLKTVCETMMRSGHIPADMKDRMVMLGWWGFAERPKIQIGGLRPPPLPPRGR